MTDFSPQHEPRPAEKKWLPRLLLALLIVGSVAGVTWLAVSNPPATTLAAEDQSTTTTSEPLEIEAPIYQEGVEPIADAAERILPSVVQIRTTDGVGSGVVFGEGLILTAAHVVAGEDTVLVRLETGENLEGTVVGGTSEADIAVVRIDRTDVPIAELALDYKPRVGQMAIAVGSPWGLASTVTAGIVSAVDQPLGCDGGGNCRSLLQTDAAINPGNSGGALVDRQGRVLGINVSIFSLSGANDGVGFAVPIDVAYDLAQTVLAGDPIEFAFLGVVGSDVETGRAGTVITEVLEGSAADEAGLEVDDLVVSIDGVRVTGIADLASLVRTYQPGEVVDLVIVRDGEERTIEVTLGVRDEETS
ncbi:MAG: PDZ domain-containing protein [Actinobacteria bacterium]|nr:MAG: PDZ domain-containing protein [Actinomycetota bacterium]REK37792.1 MAG: PDZ domain-containing protein [Actinomycetota bacterium]